MLAIIYFSFAISVFIVSAGNAASSQKQDQFQTCVQGMNMVKTYLETSKVELIKNIKAAKSSQCKAQAWRKVDRSMVSHSHAKGVTYSLLSDETGKLTISASVTNHGCGKGPGSSFVIHIKGNWRQIMYTQVFKGSASCWAIFGNKRNEKLMTHNAGLEVFNPTFGDIIFGEKKMSSSTDDVFRGQSVRCDNKKDNFWHGLNGSGERQATVLLRRKNGAINSGIQTDTSCGTPSYIIKDIFVFQ